MAAQVSRRCRFAMTRQIGRRGAQHMLQGHQPARHQTGILQPVRAAYRQVVAFLDDVHAPVLQVQVQRQVRMARQEGGNRGRQTRQREGHGRADAQRARGRGLQRPERLLGLAQLVQDARDLLVVARARLGQAHAPRGAIQQARRDVGLEFGDVLADGGGRQAELPRRGGEAALLHHLPEYPQRGQMVHGLFTFGERYRDHNGHYHEAGIQLAFRS